MKNLLFLCLVVLSTNLLAGNGPYIIGLSAASKGLGGTGVSNYLTGSDAIFKNPSLLTRSPGKDGTLSFDATATLVKQNVTASNNGLASGTQSSTAGAQVLPNLGMGYKLSPSLSVGFAAFVEGGATSDFSTQALLSKTKVESLIARFAPAVAYKLMDQLSVGVSPFLRYGELALNTGGSTRQAHGSVAFGAEIGISSSPIDGLSLGASFTPKTSLKYKQAYDLSSLGPAGATGTLNDIATEEPMQLGFGVSYSISSDWTVAGDYRLIGWESADVFRELGWMNQSVFALGTQYALGSWDFRLGFNHCNSPYGSVAGETGTTVVSLSGVNVFQQLISNLNVIGFPAIVGNTFTGGIGYRVNADLSLDTAFTYAPKVTVTRAGNTAAALGSTYSYTGTASQWSLALSATYRM